MNELEEQSQRALLKHRTAMVLAIKWLGFAVIASIVCAMTLSIIVSLMASVAQKISSASIWLGHVNWTNMTNLATWLIIVAVALFIALAGIGNYLRKTPR